MPRSLRIDVPRGIKGVLPSAAEVRQWTDESVIDPYNRETHY